MKHILILLLTAGFAFAGNISLAKFNKLSIQQQIQVINSSHGKQKEKYTTAFEKNMKGQDSSINVTAMQMGGMKSGSFNSSSMKAQIQAQIKNMQKTNKFR